MTALPVTLKGVPAFAEAGATVVTLLTLMSAVASRFVVLGLLVFALLPDVGSVTCSWSTATDVVVVKL
jgi:hypothetical protein